LLSGAAREDGLDWSLEHFGSSDFNDPATLDRFRAAIREADILIGWQSMSIETVDRLATLLTQMDRAGELDRVKFLWYDVPDPRLGGLMFQVARFRIRPSQAEPVPKDDDGPQAFRREISGTRRPTHTGRRVKAF